MKRTDSYLNRDYDFNFNFDMERLTIIGLIFMVILIVFIAPWVSFWLAYFGGWIAKITIGKYLVSGLSLIGLNISLNNIPLLAGVLGWIGGFFKATISTKKKN